MNVRRVEAVKEGRNTASRSASERGTVAPGSIDGSLSRGWCRHRRCFLLHPPRSRTWPFPARRHDLRTSQRQKLRNTTALAREIRLIPVLVEGAAVPKRSQLPGE